MSIEQRHVHANDVVALLHSVEMAPIYFTKIGNASPLNWHSHRVPPPTDLIVAFQHFVI
jgi:hypothetical protein